jgi:hypothetical protein
VWQGVEEAVGNGSGQASCGDLNDHYVGANPLGMGGRRVENISFPRVKPAERQVPKAERLLESRDLEVSCS